MKKEVKQKYAIVDCETGGLNCLENPVTEVAVVIVDKVDFTEINRWESLVKPYAGLTLNPEALKRTGITINMLNTGRTIDKVVEMLIKLFESVTPKGDRGQNRPILVGHNVGFDIRFLVKAFELCNKCLWDYVHSSTEDRKELPAREGDISRLDTMMMAREIWGEEERMTLGFCCKRIGIDIIDSHRAMNDVMATWKLLVWMIQRLRIDKKERNSDIVKGAKAEDDDTRQIREFHEHFEF